MATQPSHKKNVWHKFRTALGFNRERQPPAGIEKLQEEIDLLTSYFTDTIYRLRYDSMEYDYISPSVKNLLGYQPEEIHKIGFRSLILETRIISEGMRKVASYKDYEQRRKDGEAIKWQADYLFRTKDDRRIWISDISYPWFDETRKVIGSIGILRDITERVTAEQSVKEELARLATTDPLTGLHNRRYFFDCLQNELKRIERSSKSLSVLLLDVDHFKKINDTYGHSVGDNVLGTLADIMRSCLREIDVSARVGGEEFAAILIDSPAYASFHVAERMRTKISGHSFTFKDLDPFSCTVSIGICGTNCGDNDSDQELYKRADACLYQAKASGRNQVAVDEGKKLTTQVRIVPTEEDMHGKGTGAV
jgi:diguanylate cyclase (GGDEF)-like protein/PAS domain S-box-containing protein